MADGSGTLGTRVIVKLAIAERSAGKLGGLPDPPKVTVNGVDWPIFAPPVVVAAM
jgi:hypothetical protein